MKKEESKFKIVKRGEVFYADLGEGIGSEQSGIRPVVVIQNDIGNRFSPTVIIASITSKTNKTKLPTHINIGEYDGLDKGSMVLLEQIRAIDKKRLKEYRCTLSKDDLKKVDKGTLISLGL